MTLDEFLDTTFYFYYGLLEQWLITNGAKRKDKPEAQEAPKAERKVLTFDQLPDGYW